MSTRHHAAAFLLLTVVAAIWYAALTENRQKILRVSFLDVGQGDSVFIDAPSGRQMLIDGGKGRVVLQRLAEVMPWYDRSLDVVMATHPDADHIGGIPDVLSHFTVGLLVQSSVQDEEGSDQKALVAASGAARKAYIAERGDVIDLGKGVYFEVLFPDRAVPSIETNTGCLVGRLVYGNTAFMFSCDAPKQIEKYLAALDGGRLRADVLKAGHHGSKTSSDPLFIGFVDPAYVVYSRGCSNGYGHPHQETVAQFQRFGVTARDTCTEGTVTFISDGQRVTVR